jgi:hypothetical protein
MAARMLLRAALDWLSISRMSSIIAEGHRRRREY